MKTIAALLFTAAALHAEPTQSAQRAAEVTDYIRETFWNKKTELYASNSTDIEKPDFIWGGGVQFSALVGAASHDKRYLSPMKKYFEALHGYWDDKVKIPGYEPSPTAGNGSDKYYDDNAWMVITFVEAFELTKDSRYLKRSEETLDFVLSGWDEEAGGGIWWHEKHADGSKNTCSNAPAAVGCLMVARHNEKRAPELIQKAKDIVEWTNKNLRADNGLFGDRIVVATGKIHGGQLTYNSALMLRANLYLYHATKEEAYLREARKIGNAAEALTHEDTGAYRDSIKWSHLMVEADLDLYRETKEKYLLDRAKKNCEVHYQQFKTKPATSLIDTASLARELWLLAEFEK